MSLTNPVALRYHRPVGHPGLASRSHATCASTDLNAPVCVTCMQTRARDQMTLSKPGLVLLRQRCLAATFVHRRLHQRCQGAGVKTKTRDVRCGTLRRPLHAVHQGPLQRLPRKTAKRCGRRHLLQASHRSQDSCPEHGHTHGAGAAAGAQVPGLTALGKESARHVHGSRGQVSSAEGVSGGVAGGGSRALLRQLVDGRRTGSWRECLDSEDLLRAGRLVHLSKDIHCAPEAGYFCRPGHGSPSV